MCIEYIDKHNIYYELRWAVEFRKATDSFSLSGEYRTVKHFGAGSWICDYYVPHTYWEHSNSR